PQERRRQLMEITRKQRELNAARIGVAERRFEQETRSPAWAEPHEQALQQALVRDTIDSMLMDVECRETMCRVELSAIDSNAAFALKRGEQFTKELGEQIATKMQGGGFDRVLVIYSARDGSVLD
ncbi:MAG: hypothetical protein OXT09_18320, partial [Myxococcales bacterium]|nr:hypothetical protein [Myxococcales bacterium]